MKKVFALCGAALLFVPALGSATSLTVQSAQAQLRSDPSFGGKIITSVRYRSSVELLEQRGPWRLVKFRQQQGWMHISALVAPSVKLKAGQTLNDRISSKEVSLAGKGFNKEVENKYKQSHSNLNFAAVDKMEQLTVTPSELEKFAVEGDFSNASITR